MFALIKILRNKRQATDENIFAKYISGFVYRIYKGLWTFNKNKIRLIKNTEMTSIYFIKSVYWFHINMWKMLNIISHTGMVAHFNELPLYIY